MSRSRARKWFLRTLLPREITAWTRVSAWLLLVSNILIVATGGAVRLTGSGMGCPTWPYCTSGSLIPTAELTYHSVIEFGNRTLTSVLVVISLLAFLAVLRLPAERRIHRVLTFSVGLGIIVQALIGGVTVWLHLHPSVVGVHYIVSAVLVSLATVNLNRLYAPAGERRRATSRRYAVLTHVTTLAVAVTVVIGVLLTGAGPHAGDAAAARNGLDPVFWQHVHSWPAYATFALTIALVVGSRWTPRAQRLTRWTLLLLLVELVQIAVGLWQARTGVPPLLVGIHMVLAVCLVAAMTTVVVHLKAPLARLREPVDSSAEVHAAR